jgi:DHA3 family macrolide efflux protein-like MFS transporter
MTASPGGPAPDRPSAAAGRWQVPFFSLWAGQAFSLLGSALVQFALIWWLTDLTHSARVLATATLAGVLPGVVLAPFAGVFVDRFSRRLVMIAADVLVALATLGLMSLFAAGVAQPWHVYVVLFIRAAAGTFQFPAMQASTTLMVPSEHLARVAGFNQMLQGGMSVVAPPVGALLLSLAPMQGVLAVDLVTAVMGIAPLLFITIPEPARSATDPGQARPSVGAELRAGLRYVVSWPGLFIVVVMACIINLLFSPASALMPLLVTDFFRGGAGHLAAINSSFGLGVVAGGLALGAWGGFRRRVLTSLLGLAGLGAGFAMLGLIPANAFWLALGVGFVAAVMQVFTNGPLFAILQAVVEPGMQGRVFSLLGALASGASPLGLVAAAPLADSIGVRAWYVIAGGSCVLLALIALSIPAVMTLESQRQASEAPAAAGVG